MNNDNPGLGLDVGENRLGCRKVSKCKQPKVIQVPETAFHTTPLG